MQNARCVIVGAGVSGLTLAYMLSRAGKNVVVIERDARVGGLAKSFTYRHGNRTHIFDIGPKRFHTDDKEITAFITSVLSHHVMPIKRASGVYFLGRYFNWPITPKDIVKLPAKIQVSIATDIFRKLIHRQQAEPKNFTEEIINSYGPTLYQSFFEGYTEKFIRIPAPTVHRDWATTGINRSIIDPKAKGNSLSELIQAVLIPKAVHTTFLYPNHDGFGLFCTKLTSSIKKSGGTVLTNTTITKLDYAKKRIKLSDGRDLSFDTLIWSGNLNALATLLDTTFDNIAYLSTILYQVIVRGNIARSDQWIYYADKDISFVRATFPRNIAAYATARGYDSVMLEVTCAENDALWFKPEMLQHRIHQDLVKTGLIPNKDRIAATHIQAIKDTYPVYHVEYAKGFARASSFVHSRYPAIRLLGRSGTFWYNNSDHSIKAALGMAKFLLGKNKTVPDKLEIFSKQSITHS